jgi:hypothetical protein
VPVVRGWRSKNDREAAAYLIASNRLVEAGGWDDEEFAAMLEDMGGEFDGTGFTQAELDLLSKHDPSNVEFPVFDETSADAIKMVTCPKCANKSPA